MVEGANFRASHTIKRSYLGAMAKVPLGKSVLTAMRAMNKPLIAMHVNPDADALGGAIALAVHLKQPGRTPTLFIREPEKVPALFRDIIKTKEITVTSSVSSQQHDGLIMVDTADENLLETPVWEALKQMRSTKQPVVDIDHHRDKVLVDRELTIASKNFSSACELVADLMAEKDIDETTAQALLAGMVFDTRKFNFNVGKYTLALAAKLELIGKKGKEELYSAVNELSEADASLIKDCLKRFSELYIEVAGSYHNIKSVVVTHDQITKAHNNWRKVLQDELGFVKKADIVLIVYYDTAKGKYRGSMCVFNEGSSLDLMKTAEEISKGGGHPGAVGFDIPQNVPIDEAVEFIQAMLTRHGRPKGSV